MSERLEKLLGFLNEEPNDPFLLYAVANEYAAVDAHKALEYYRQLLHEHEQYVATYYHAAALMDELGMIEEAQAVYQKGISVAAAAQEAKAKQELQQAYQNFLFENDLDDDM